jgi:hypothetical protein
MPMEYERVDVRRRIVITFQGAFQAADVLAVMARYRAEDTWSHGLLRDTRNLTGPPALADLRRFIQEDAPSRPDAGPRGPVATWPPTRLCTGWRVRLRPLGRSKITIEVFRNWTEADQWLLDHAR